MGIYSVKTKGWRYDFTQAGIRHTEAWFKTKKEAQRAEAKNKEELKNPQQMEMTQIAMVFLELVNLRLDYMKAYNSEKHYKDCFYMAKRWVKIWADLLCTDISQEMIQRFVLDRNKVSSFAANKEIRCLKALFNFGIKKKYISCNPVNGIELLPIEKRVKYIPASQDIDKVIDGADQDTQDYLWAIRESIGRMGEINRLTWNDVNLNNGTVTLYTRKKKGGHLTPRSVFMTEKLFSVIKRRHSERDPEKPWVFWHTYWSRKIGKFVDGPYQDRKKLMRTLCKRAGVKYFRYHALRHAGASMMDNNNVPIGAIQKILGHEQRTTTEIYLHGISEIEKQAMATYEVARQKSHTDSHTNIEYKKSA
jgi:integrase